MILSGSNESTLRVQVSAVQLELVSSQLPGGASRQLGLSEEVLWRLTPQGGRSEPVQALGPRPPHHRGQHHQDRGPPR